VPGNGRRRGPNKGCSDAPRGVSRFAHGLLQCSRRAAPVVEDHGLSPVHVHLNLLDSGNFFQRPHDPSPGFFAPHSEHHQHRLFHLGPRQHLRHRVVARSCRTSSGGSRRAGRFRIPHLGTPGTPGWVHTPCRSTRRDLVLRRTPARAVGVPVCEQGFAAITVIHQDGDAMGRFAADRLFARLDAPTRRLRRLPPRSSRTSRSSRPPCSARACRRRAAGRSGGWAGTSSRGFPSAEDLP